MEKCINGVSFDGKSVTNSIYSLEKNQLNSAKACKRTMWYSYSDISIIIFVIRILNSLSILKKYLLVPE